MKLFQVREQRWFTHCRQPYSEPNSEAPNFPPQPRADQPGSSGTTGEIPDAMSRDTSRVIRRRELQKRQFSQSTREGGERDAK